MTDDVTINVKPACGHIFAWETTHAAMDSGTTHRMACPECGETVDVAFPDHWVPSID